ncbi:collectin-10-like [Branchiostoma floridae x Branchiostoma belcheri]
MSSSCPKDYTKWRGICYKAFNTEKTFDQGTAACGEDGGTLAMPRDAETNAYLGSLVIDWAYWIGLHDQREEGRFEWTDGSALGPYNFWEPGEPNDDGGNEDCVLYSTYSSRKYYWNDYDCQKSLHFICQTAPGTYCIFTIS